MKDRVFLDTNVLVYLYSNTEQLKRGTAISLFKKYVCFTSTQALNEFNNVYTKKYKLPAEEIIKFNGNINKACRVQLVTEEIIYNSLRLHEKYGYSYFDCLMLSSALESDCKILFTEDMADGQLIEEMVRIVNPFTVK